MTTIGRNATSEGYEAYFGLVEPPFSLSPDPRFLFESRSHSAALDLVMQSFRLRQAIVLVTGEVGTGKTMLCRTVLQRVPRRTFLSVITKPLLDTQELLRQVLRDFGILSNARALLDRTSPDDFVRPLEQFLSSLTQLQAHAVIMIDEAQDLPPDALKGIRLLSNIERDGSKLLQIVLVGQPELSEVLARPDMGQLAEQVSHRIELQPLERSEVEHYIARRLWIAHGSPRETTRDNSRVQFSADALASIADFSHGLPRAINLLCERGIEDVYARKKTTVSARAILNAARQLDLPVPIGTRLRAYRHLGAAALLVALAAGIWGVWRVQGPENTRRPVAAGAGPTSPSAVGGPGPSTPPDPAVQSGTLHEAESFTVLVASLRTSVRAKAIVEQATGLGLPAFARSIPGNWQQVIVGPYVSREEALDVQRRLNQALLTGSLIVSTPTAETTIALAGGSAVTRALLLPASDRASIAIDLADETTRALVLSSADDRVFGVEIGPFRQSVTAQDLQPAVASPMVGAVAVRGVAQPNDTLAHVTVNVRTPVTGTVRLSKQRVYIDLVPRQTVAGPPAAAPATDQAAKIPAVTSPPPQTVSNEDSERATLDQAREFSKVPDVRAIQRLRAQLLQRRGRPLDEPPVASADDRVMRELIGYLEVAQKLQLAMDARLLREAQAKEPQ